MALGEGCITWAYALYRAMPMLLVVVQRGKAHNAMPFIPAANCVQVEMVYRWDNQIVQNVLHYVLEAPWSVGEMEELAAGIVTVWDAAWQPITPSNVTLISIRVVDLSSAEAPVVEWVTGLPLNGGSGSPSLPNNVTLAITKRTAFRGRSRRGRVYQIGLEEGAVTGNTVDSAKVAQYIANWEALNPITVGASEAIMVVASFYSDGSARSSALLTPIIGFTSDGLVDSQRRRLPGRGN